MAVEQEETLLPKGSHDVSTEEEELSPGHDPVYVSRYRKRQHVVSRAVYWSSQVLMVVLILALFLDIAVRRGVEQHHEHDTHAENNQDPDENTIQHLSNTGNNNTVSCDCGKSVAEARRLGCQYDTLAASWLPDACRDNALAREFDAAGPGGRWTYYADAAGTQVLSLEQVAALPDQPANPSGGGGNCFWVTQRWHLLHCTFYWRKLFRQPATGVVMERHYHRMGHIDHCEGLLLGTHETHNGDGGSGLDDIITEAAVGLSGETLELGPSGGCRGGCPSDRRRAKGEGVWQ